MSWGAAPGGGGGVPRGGGGGAQSSTRQQLERLRRRQHSLRSAHQTPFGGFNEHDEYGGGGGEPHWATPGPAHYPPLDDGGAAYHDEWGGRGALHAFSPYAAYDDGHYGRTPLDSLPRDMRLDPDPGWGRGGADWYGGGGGGGGGGGHGGMERRYMDHLPRHFAMDDHDPIQTRMRWREEVLSGNPDKLPLVAVEMSTLVISFISRGPASHPHGQGDELLFFRPRRKDPTRAQYQQDLRAPWTFLFIEATPILPSGSTEKPPSSDDLSKESIGKVLPSIDVATDLKLVRKSKPLRWDDTTMLETFLYRLVESKEDLEGEEYKVLEKKLGEGMHYWTQLNGFHGAIESDVVSTAIMSVHNFFEQLLVAEGKYKKPSSVCLPMALSTGLDHIFADTVSRSEQLAAAALDVLYLCVQAGYARDAFRHYPIPPPVTGKSELEVVVKRRMWAYWTEVTAWHLCRIRPAAEVSITYSVTKALSAVRDAIDDPKIKIDDVEKLLVNSIAFEADRARNAGRQLIREGVAEILYNPAFSLDKPSGDPALDSLHLFTHSSASAVYGVLAKLITHVLSRKGSPGPGSSTSRKIWDLKITIAESRPLNEGVALAIGLGEVIGSYAKYKEKTAEINRRTSEPPGISDLGPSALDNGVQAKLRELLGGTLSPLKQVKDGVSMLSPGRQTQALGLAHLLAELDSKKEVREPKVSIEVVTDSALPSVIMAAGKSGIHPVILLGAERVLSTGDVVNKVGSAQVAWSGQKSGGSVLCLVRSDRIHPSNISVPSQPSNPGSELVSAWKCTLPPEQLESFTTLPFVSISNPIYDETNHEFISGYITDMGFMGNELLTEFSKIQAETVAALGLA